MKIKITVHLHVTKYSWQTESYFEVFSYKISNENHSYINSQEVEIEVPENYDPRPAQIAALEAQRQKVMAEFRKSVTDINRRISELSALEQAA
jgi:hypothetical protein